MWWCMRRRSRTICLSLAVVTVCLHLSLVLLSVSQQPCSPSSSSPLPRLQRALDRANYSLVGAGTLVKTPTDTDHMALANEVAKGHSRSAPHKLAAKAAFEDPPVKGVAPKETEGVSLNISAAEGGRATSHMPPGVSKLEALFSHPLYNMPTLPIPEDDWLLRVKPKVKPSEKSSQMWMSAGENDYENVQWNSSSDTHPPWLRFHLGISRWQLYPHRDANMEALTQQLSTHRIVSAVQKSGGTQLKLVMSFPNYGQALFKPMKQDRDEESNYNLYYFSDFERHNAEISAFHLDRILGYRRIPPAVGRLVDVVKEIKDITTDHKLAKTFFTSPVGNACFYGQCSYYCSTEHALCGRPRALEASLAVMLPDLSLATRRTWRSPWRRSYSRSKLAKWETEPDYCETVKKISPYDKGTRLVDVIDMVILDFLMSNMDRHHYETFEKFGNNTFLVHLDNGRGFGRHSKDEPSILVPLEQCCRIRRSTLLRLRLLSQPQYRLSDVMRESLSQDPLSSVAPLLSAAHLAALDRRLATVLKTVSHCQERRSREGKGDEVIYDDIDSFEGMVTSAA